jgi:hypothetical protein
LAGDPGSSNIEFFDISVGLTHSQFYMSFLAESNSRSSLNKNVSRAGKSLSS